MGRIGAIKHEDYGPEKLDRIFHLVENAAKLGEGRFYEVFLDDMKIVPRTCDPEQLNLIAEFVGANSECLTIYLYYGASKHSDTYNFYFKGIPVAKANPQDLSGINIGELAKQEKDKILKELHYEGLEKENAELRSQIEELEEALVKQQEYIEKAKSAKIDSYAELGTAILLKAANHPWVIKKLPLLGALAGLGEAPKEEAKEKEETKPEETATFKRKGEKTEEPASEEDTYGEQERAMLAYLNEIFIRFGKERTDIFGEIVKDLYENPHALEFTRKQIRNFLKGKPGQELKKA